MNQQRKLLISSPRVLDLTDDKGFLCGRILADLGADVIKIEKPGGDQGRNIGPFYHDIPHPENSLYWLAFNAGKRGITLDIAVKEGQEIFKKLVKVSDFVIESFPPRYMDKLGLGYSAISQINPRIIFTSITPFGQTGPYKDFKAPDIVGIALSGWMYTCGDPDRAPVRVSFPQSYLNASSEAAAASTIAYYYRERTGKGQYIDVSMRESLIPAVGNAPTDWELTRTIVKRDGCFRTLPGSTPASPARLRWIWQCRDGFVAFLAIGGAAGAFTNRRLVEWMDSERMADDFLKGWNWENWHVGKTIREEIDRIEPQISKFFMTHTKAELYDGALKRRIMIMPVSSPKDIVENPQLQAREFWTKVVHPELKDSVVYPGNPVKCSEAYCEIERRAPLIGEHNLEIFEKELGLTREELLILKQSGVI